MVNHVVPRQCLETTVWEDGSLSNIAFTFFINTKTQNHRITER